MHVEYEQHVIQARTHVCVTVCVLSTPTHLCVNSAWVNVHTLVAVFGCTEVVCDLGVINIRAYAGVQVSVLGEVYKQAHVRGSVVGAETAE